MTALSAPLVRRLVVLVASSNPFAADGEMRRIRKSGNRFFDKTTRN
jgi:hypothetical protein